MDNASLTSLANLYGSDKGTVGPDPNWESTSNYTDIYEAYLWPMREEPIRLLEIGLGVAGDTPRGVTIARGKNKYGGASIKMWADYFPNAHLFGIDINSAPYLDTDRITTFVADQADPQALQKVFEEAGSEPFDVIIDDGSHRHDHQQISFGVLFPYLRPGGFYFIEDIGAGNDTRRVFREMSQKGRFGTPNAIMNEEVAAAVVDWVHFHSPAIVPIVQKRRSIRQPFRILTKFRPDSDRMCVIRRLS